MVRKVLMMESRSYSRRMPSWQAAGTPLATLLLVCGAVMLPMRHARAAMNFVQRLRCRRANAPMPIPASRHLSAMWKRI